MIKQDLRNLKKRYLIWFYKTTKDSLDRIERKFTQLEVDYLVLKELKKNRSKELEPFIADFKAYIQKKEADGKELRFSGNLLKPDYRFLVLKLEAIEKAIVKELGKQELARIKGLYEAEMTERILKSTEH